MVHLSGENKRIMFILVVIIGLFVSAYFLSFRNIGIVNQKETYENSDKGTTDTTTQCVNSSSNNLLGKHLLSGNDLKNAVYQYSSPITQLNNPSSSKYVIQIPKGIKNTYMIPVKVEGGTTYELSFWVSGDKLTTQDGKLNGVVDLSTKNKKNIDSCINFRHNSSAVTKSVDGKQWSKKNIVFNTPQNMPHAVELHFSVSNTIRYIADPVLNKVVNNMKGFKVTNGLVSSYILNKSNLSGNDIIENVKNQSALIPSNSLKFGTTSNGVNILGKELTSQITPSDFKKSDANNIGIFTFVIYCDTLSIDEEASILHIDGNQETSLHLTLNKGLVDSEDGEEDSKMGYFSMKYGDDNDRHDSKPHFLTGKNVYFFTCTGNSVKCYLNETETPFWSFDTKSKLYFNRNLTINKGGKWNANIKALLLYNRVLDINDRSDIICYLKYSLPKENKSKMEEYTFNSCLNSGPSTLYNKHGLTTNIGDANNIASTSNIGDIDIDLSTVDYHGTKNFKKYIDLKKDGSSQIDNTYNPKDDLELTIDLEGSGGGGSKPTEIIPGAVPPVTPPADNNNCLDTCINSCSTNTLKNNAYGFLSCINDCKKLPECTTYCSSSSTASKPYICTDIDLDNVKVTNSCPNVYQQNGNYYVHVPKTSFYGHVYGNTNLTKNYGPSKENARTVYQKNYPKCEIPDSLKDHANVDPNKCPYTVDERNPCTSSNCRNVDWGDDNSSVAGLTPECKNDIINYCKNNHPLDPNCASWKPENKHDPASQKHRRQFEDQCDEDCTPGRHPIESHPDYSGYIKKDNIPCWNCNLK